MGNGDTAYHDMEKVSACHQKVAAGVNVGAYTGFCGLAKKLIVAFIKVEK